MTGVAEPITEPIEIPSPVHRVVRARPRPTVLIGAVCLALALVGGFAGAVLRVLGGSDGGGRVLTRGVVEPAGGVLDFGDGGELRIPPDALDRPRMITVRLHPPGDVRGEVEGRLPARVYGFEPPGLRFRRPVTLRLPLPPGSPSGAAVLLGETGPRRLQGNLDAGGRILVVRLEDLSFSGAVGRDRGGS